MCLLKQSGIYFEVLESLKEQSQSQEDDVIIKIYENAIRAMINVSFFSQTSLKRFSKIIF